MKKINLALVGCGYWGPNLLRHFYQHKECQLCLVCDIDPAAREYVQKRYPQVPTTADFNAVLDPSIDAVVIATDATSHYALAKDCLEAGRHVLVEKPMTMQTAHADELVAIAQRHNVRLMTGHTFEYHPAVRALKEILQKGTIGQTYYVTSQRVNYGIVRHDINALWSLAPHDISILIYLFECMPTSVSAVGYAFLQRGIEDVVFLQLNFSGNIHVHLQVSWLNPEKIRRMTFVGSQKMIVYDDLAEHKVVIYDKGLQRSNIYDSLGVVDDFIKFQKIRSAGDMTVPQLDTTEPLKLECDHFIQSIIEGRDPLTDGANGRRVIAVLEAAQKSLDLNGELTMIQSCSHESVI
ncbi:MAG: Gfo/Idh/MocA family oxidoreductase [Candidatus Omnitrophica bacterium]|nr:Gfo/Idh/MocA family oxidoreductase [Candidatus Omnitrophota bacterium]